MTESEFKVGDKVFDLRYGFGRIIRIGPTIHVNFLGVDTLYLISGRREIQDNFPSLLTLDQAKALGHRLKKEKTIELTARQICEAYNRTFHFYAGAMGGYQSSLLKELGFSEEDL